jgi:SAM-dependent methyltransferase
MTSRTLRSPWSDAHKLSRDNIARLVGTAAPYVSGDLLDVGCGMKPYEALLGGRTTSWMGIDFVESASGQTRADVFGSALDMPFADESFDTVLCTQVAEHVPEPARLFAECARVLRPSGTLILTTPQTEEMHEQPHDYFRYTRYGLQYLAQTHGFQVIALQPFGGAVQTFALLAARELPKAFKIAPLHIVAKVAVAVINITGSIFDRWWLATADRHTITIGHLLVARKP